MSPVNAARRGEISGERCGDHDRATDTGTDTALQIEVASSSATHIDIHIEQQQL